MRANPRPDLNVIVSLAQRGFLATVFSPGIYVALSAIVLGASLTLLSYRNAVLRDYMLILNNPFSSALLVSAILASIYLAIAACTAVAREKENGTLFVLFTGPVSHASYVLGSFSSHLLSTAFILVVIAASLWLISWVTGFLLPGAIAGGLLYMLVCASGVVALAILGATAAGKTRPAILLLILVSAVLLILQGGDSLLYIPAYEEATRQVYVVGRIFHSINGILRWVSPFSYMVNGLDALLMGNRSALVPNLLGSVLLTACSLLLAVRTLAAKGVRP